jgi:hypothetical protein
MSANQDETKIIEKTLEKHKEQCPYNKDKDNWFDSRLIKVAGTVLTLLTPLFVWIVLEIFAVKGEVALVKQRQDIIMEMQRDIRDIKDSLVDLKIKVGKIEQKVDIK